MAVRSWLSCMKLHPAEISHLCRSAGLGEDTQHLVYPNHCHSNHEPVDEQGAFDSAALLSFASPAPHQAVVTCSSLRHVSRASQAEAQRSSLGIPPTPSLRQPRYGNSTRIPSLYGPKQDDNTRKRPEVAAKTELVEADALHQYWDGTASKNLDLEAYDAQAAQLGGHTSIQNSN
jgi:hypothetical protein